MGRRRCGEVGRDEKSLGDSRGTLVRTGRRNHTLTCDQFEPLPDSEDEDSEEDFSEEEEVDEDDEELSSGGKRRSSDEGIKVRKRRKVEKPVSVLKCYILGPIDSMLLRCIGLPETKYTSTSKSSTSTTMLVLPMGKARLAPSISLPLFSNASITTCYGERFVLTIGSFG